MAAADSSRFGDPRSGYAQHPPPPPPSHPYAHHHHHHPQHQVLQSNATAAVPAGIPQQSPSYPPQQQQQHSIPPPHHHHQPQYGQLPPSASATNTNAQGGHLDGSMAGAGAAAPNGRFIPGPAEAPMDSGGGGPSLVHPSYAGMQPHQHQQHQHQQHHPQHPHQQFYAQPQQHPSQQQQHHHQPHHHHPSGMGPPGTGMGDASGGAMGGGQQQQQMAPLLPPPGLGAAGVYVPAPPPVTFPVEPQLDFTQIFRLFNMTITASPLSATSESINDSDRSSRGSKISNLPPSTWNSMVQSAMDGLRALDPMVAEKYAASLRELHVPEVADVVVGPDVGGAAGVNGAHAGAAGVNGNGVVEGGAGYGDDEGPDGKKRRQDDKGAEPQECLTCHAKSSPEWRRGPFGPRTLCNACGLVYIKIMKRRAKGLPDEEDENGGDGDDNDGSGSDD